MLHIRCQYAIVLGLLTISSLLTSTEPAVKFPDTPASPLYVVKGGTARFVWTYHVDDRNTEFEKFSPIWFYNDISNVIGRDHGLNGWSFQIVSRTCPPRLLSPTVRVSRVDQATLVIKDVVPADTGTYGCTLELRSGYVITRTVQLNVTELSSDNPSSSSSPQDNCQDVVVGAWIATTLLIISLIVNVLLVLYIYRNNDRLRFCIGRLREMLLTLRKKQEAPYDDVEGKSSASHSHTNTGATFDSEEPQPQTQQPAPPKPSRAKDQGIPDQQATYATPEDPGNQQTSQDHYQQLDPATLQHDPTVQYEGLRKKDATCTDSGNDTYEQLRNRPAEYEMLHKYASVSDTPNN